MYKYELENLAGLNRRRIRTGYSPNSFFEAKVGAKKLGVPWVLYMPSAKRPQHTEIITE